MIHWTVGETNFYRTYMKRRAKDSIEEERRLQIRLKAAEKQKKKYLLIKTKRKGRI